MKKYALILILLCVASAAAQAQLLWKVQREGDEKTSYLFGTHHFAPLTILNGMPVEKLISEVDEVYGELSLDEMNSMISNPALAATAMMAPADSTLDKVFTPAELAEVSDKLVAMFNEPMMSMAVKQMNSMKPAALEMVILQLAVSKLMPDFDMTQQLDKTLLTMGANAGKPVKGLETLNSQLSAMFGGSLRSQAESILNSLRRNEPILDRVKAMTELYTAGKTAELYDLSVSSMDSAQKKSMLDDRNDAWINFMLGIIPTTSVFIICGAGHLGGDKGLINQLRANGYNVEPVEYQPAL